MTDEQKTGIYNSIWVAVGALKVLRDSAPNPAGIDCIVAELEKSVDVLMEG
jgi:hypothetical protein